MRGNYYSNHKGSWPPFWRSVWLVSFLSFFSDRLVCWWVVICKYFVLLKLVWWWSLHLFSVLKSSRECFFFLPGDGKSMTAAFMRAQHCSGTYGVRASDVGQGRRHLGCQGLSEMNNQQWWMVITLNSYIKCCDMILAVSLKAKCDWLPIINLFFSPAFYLRNADMMWMKWAFSLCQMVKYNCMSKCVITTAGLYIFLTSKRQFNKYWM